MIARAQACDSDISVLIDSDIVLLPDFMSALYVAHKLEHDWFLVATSPVISHFPFYLNEAGDYWLQEDGKRIKLKKGQDFKMLVAWKTGDLPLHAGVLPPFLYGKGIHNQWPNSQISRAKAGSTRLILF
ncbi:hypothetical protein ACHQM5_025364 [Ranunculus cassubicifolius]